MSRASFCRTRLLVTATLALAAAAHAQTASPRHAPARAAKPAVAHSAAPNPADNLQAQAYYHYMLAHEYEEMAGTYGRPEYANHAIEEYQQALSEDPNSKYLKGHLAELYFRTGRIRDAIVAAQEQIKANPNDLEAHKLLAGIYLQSLSNDQQDQQISGQMLQLAINEYAKIAQLEPKDAQNHVLLGRLYAANHDSARAEEQFKAAFKADPTSEDTILNMARFYSEEGDDQRAIATLAAVAPEDQTARIEYALGLSYDQQKDTKHAILAYRRALDLDPDNPDVERALAKSLLADNQFGAALSAYRDVAAADPSDAEALLRISDILRHQGHFQESLDSLKKAKALSPDSLEINYDEGLLQDALGQYDEAAAAFEILATKSDHPSGRYSDDEKNDRSLFLDRLANVYREQNKTDLAVKAYEQMALLGGEYAERAYQSEVDAYRDAHEYDKAVAAAQTAVNKLPNDRAMKMMLAGELADTGHVGEAMTMDKALLTGKSGDQDVYLSMAQIETRLKHWKEAGEDIDKAEQFSTKTEDKIYAYFLRGALDEREKHFEAAEGDFRKILALDPNNSMTLNYLGYMLADRGEKLDEALGMIRKAVQLDPLNYAYLDSLGWVYFKMGQYPQAEQDLREASVRNSTDPTVHDHLGELYEKTGRLKLAASQWEESLNEFAHTLPADAEPGEVSKVQKKLDNVRVRMAKESTTLPATAHP